MRDWLWVLLYPGIGLLLLLAGLIFTPPSALVRASGGEEVYQCLTVATYNGIDIGRCEDPQTGQIFHMNELGIPMVPESY